MKIKKIIVIGIIMGFISCNAQHDKVRIINDFFDHTIMNPSSDTDEMEAFLKIDKDSLQAHTKTYQLIQFNTQFLRNEINSRKDKVDILPYIEFKNKKAFTNYEVIYENKEEVYCIVQGEHFITPVIINENNKILAFFTGIVKNKNRIIPYILE